LNNNIEGAWWNLRKYKSPLLIRFRSLSKALVYIRYSYGCICDGRSLRIDDVSGDRAAGSLGQHHPKAKHEHQDENGQYSYSHRFLQDGFKINQPSVVLQKTENKH